MVRQWILTPLFVGSSPTSPGLKIKLLFFFMIAKIQFKNRFTENSFPLIKVTKSLSGKTGTATFIFTQPTFFQKMAYENFKIEGLDLVWENRKIATKDIFILFKNGKPLLVKSIFIFKNSSEWFDFLNFMNSYSKEKGFFLKQII